MDGVRRRVARSDRSGGLAVAAVRRYLFTPPRLERSRDATLILLLITLVLSLRWPASAARTAALFLAMWWLHMTTVLGFLAYLPYSKHLHLLASPFSVFSASLEPGAMPPSSEGASRSRSSPGGSCTTAWPAPSAAAATGPARLRLRRRAVAQD